MRLVLVVLFYCYSSLLFAQSDSLVFFYEKNNYQLNKAQIQQIHIDSTWESVKIYSSCDYLGSTSFNLTLSQQRADFAQKTLLDLGLNSSKINLARGLGEKSAQLENERGNPKDRKTTILIWKAEKKDKLESLTSQIKNVSLGENLIMSKLSFEGGYSLLLEESMPALEELIETLKANPSLIIKIEGHVCCSAGYEDGLDKSTGLRNLSQSRAKSIYNQLVSAGIDTNRISYEGFGGSKPIYPEEKNEFEQQANRRVEIKIISK
ncbi:MAG: OmpA family protein [Flavobacteriales bacterium]|nr:OmpA family protein [Flavobacteriales bacterium]